MPNWVNNRLTVTGKKEKLEAFKKQHLQIKADADETYRFDFNTVIPEPKVIEDCPEDCLVKEESHIVKDTDRPWFDWYSWHCKHWGTKWNACEANVIETDDELTIWFDTAWSPPEPVILKIIEMHPELEFEYKYVEEQGPVYTGVAHGSRGEITDFYEPESETKEAYEIMFDLWGNESDYRYVPSKGTYIYIGDEDAEDEASFESLHEVLKEINEGR